MARQGARRGAGRGGGRTNALGILLAGVAALLILTGGYLWSLQGGSDSFALTAGDGRSVTSQSLRGRYLLIYFGYTACPDLCPATLGAVTDAVGRLGQLGGLVQPVFISVDPMRDTPAVVARYVAAFGPRLLGLTGTPRQIAQVRRLYGIEAARHPSGAGYVVDHTSVLLLVGPDGRLVTALPAAETGGQIAARLRPYLS